MKISYQVSPKMVVEIEGTTQKEIFKALSSQEEVFGEEKCGKCESANIYFRVRTNDGNDYHEMCCSDCRAKLSFGCHKLNNTLFPKRRDDDGKFLPDNGWTRYEKPTSD